MNGQQRANLHVAQRLAELLRGSTTDLGIAVWACVSGVLSQTARVAWRLPDAPLLTVGEVARLLRVSERALREWMHHRRDGSPVIPHVRLGRRVLIRRDWVESVLSGTTQPLGGSRGAAA